MVRIRLAKIGLGFAYQMMASMGRYLHKEANGIYDASFAAGELAGALRTSAIQADENKQDLMNKGALAKSEAHAVMGRASMIKGIKL